MRILFAGTPDFVIPVLELLHRCDDELAAVCTQPDRTAGRGRRLRLSPVKQWAETHNYPVEQPQQWDDSTCGRLRALELELMVVMAYGLILPEQALTIPRFGCVNLHASLLPRWRGAAPAARAIEHGDQETGISLMKMEKGPDQGAVISQRNCSITPADTAVTLQKRLVSLGCELLLEFLPHVAEQLEKARPQPLQGVCHAPKLKKHEAWIDWTQPARRIANKVHAFNPSPVAQTRLQGRVVRIWKAAACAAAAEEEPGRVIQADRNGLLVACGQDALSLLLLQPADRKVMTATEFVNGYAPLGRTFKMLP